MSDTIGIKYAIRYFSSSRYQLRKIAFSLTTLQYATILTALGCYRSVVK